MVNGIRTSDPRGLSKGRGSKFRVISRVLHISEEGRMPYWPKRCEHNNRDENNSLKTMNDKDVFFLYLKICQCT